MTNGQTLETSGTIAGSPFQNSIALYGGTATLRATGALSVGGNITVASNGTLTIDTNSYTISVGIDSGNNSLSTNTAGIVKTGAGTLALSGRIAGSLTINQGEVTTLGFNTGSSANISNSTLTTSSFSSSISGGVSINSGGTFKAGAAFTSSGSGSITLGAADSTFDTNGFDVTFGNSISGTGTLNKAGNGTLTLSNSSHSGGTTLSGGTLALGGSSALGSSGTLSFGGGTMKFTASNTTDYSARFSTAAGQAYAFDTNGQNVTLGTGLTSSGGTLAKSGTGTLTLSGANTYSGATTVSAGTLQIGNGGTSGSLAGNITNNATVAFNRSDALTYSGAISGSGALTKSGTGTLTLSGTNTYSGGTTLNAGTIVGDAVNAYGSGTVTLASGDVSALFTASAIFGQTVTNDFVVSSGTGTATLGGATDNAGQYFRYTGSVTLDRATTLVDGGADTSGRTTFDGVISGNVGTLTITGGRVTLAATNTFAGDVVVTDGSTFQITSSGNQVLPLATNVHTSTSGNLWIVNDTTIGGLSGGSGSAVQLAVSVFANATLSVGANNANTTFAGVIRDNDTNALALTKTGSGTLTLSGTSTYSGTTTVAAGKLVVNGDLAGTSAVDVMSGGTLGGSGTIRALTTLADGASLAPGSSPGTLTFTNGLTLNGGSSLDFQLGTTSDLIRVEGLLTGPTSGQVTLNLEDAGGFTAATYTLIDFNGAFTSSLDLSDFKFGNTISGYTYSLGFDGNLLQLTATSAVPEPSTCAAIAGAGALILALWRRRRAGFARILS